MTATPEQKTRAWKTHPCRDVDAPWCRQQTGRRCINEAGERTPPHEGRLALVLERDAGFTEGAASRQVEVDRRDQIITEHAECLRVITAERDSLRVDSQRYVLEISGLNDQIRSITRDLAATRAERDTATRRYDDHMTTVHPTVPVPTTKRTRFGACPAHPGGEKLADQERPASKWAGPVTVRQFLGTSVAPRGPKSKVLRVHVSWNLGTMTVTDLTADWVRSRCVNLLENDEVEVIHEADKKVTDNKRTYEDCVAYKNRFHDLVKQVRPDLVVVNTLTGGSLANYGGDKEERWGVIRADLLGVDCDGVHDKTSPLDIPYRDEMVSAVAFVKKYAANGYRGITVPEFGTSRPAYDTDGQQRAAWVAAHAQTFIEFGVEEVNLYDYESTKFNELTTGSPEFRVWQGFVARTAA